MTARALELPDTDWHVRRLYEFAKDLGANIITANYSRYVIDLNRPSTDEGLYKGQFGTGLCPEHAFDGEDIYLQGEKVSDAEKETRIETYWRPYHEKIGSVLSDIKDRFAYALLWDAHSIPSRVPLLFDGELPELNFGTNGGRSCTNELIERVIVEAEAAKTYSLVLNGRFKGGYITREYGELENGIHAIQVELAQRCYMFEESLEFDGDRAPRLQKTLSKLLQAFMSGGLSLYEGRE